MHEVDRPDMVWMCRPEPDDRAVFVIKPPAFLVALWKLQPFFPPQSFDLLVVHLPAFDAQEFGYLSIAVPTILLGQTDECQPQSVVTPLVRLVL